ncbi:MAG: thiamine pyrophosphate-requiring protein [Steroidobacteraceae bacterium]
MSGERSRLTAAEAFLAALARRGVEYLYVNAGTDFASIVEAYANRPSRVESRGDPAAPRLAFPTPIVCLHENVAVGMAHGYALVTGKPQAVMVHVSVGTANCVCGLLNAARDQVPLLLAAGRTPLYEQDRPGARNAPIHWAQEMFDQAGLVRELVKWDYELRDAMQAEIVVDRALAITRAAPAGPVYLTLPREVLAQEVAAASLWPSETAVPRAPAPNPADVEQLAQLIAGAELPIILTSGSGALSASQALETMQAFGQFVRRFGIGVVEYLARRVRLPSSHPLNLGTDNRLAVERADLILVVDADVPWIPAVSAPNRAARIVHIGVDPLYARYPIRSFRGDLALVTTLEQLLPPLTAALDHCAAVGRVDYAARSRRIQELAAVRRTGLEARRKRIADERRLTRAWLTTCLNEAVARDDCIVNEYWVERELLERELPGTYFATPPAGGLGWGLPAALGIAQFKKAANEAQDARVVIAAVGDGSYVFANPAACHQAAAALQLPVLTVVCNNRQWGAVEWAARGVYPDGEAARGGTPVPLSSLEPAPAFEKYVEASGGHGERVTDPQELPGALERALTVVRRERRQALLNVICE